jgi:hypothetical protein
MISDSLTKIAKGYCGKIEYVAFVPLDAETLAGIVRGSSSETYGILIDDKKQPCFHRATFCMYHEIGHIELFHLGYLFFHGDPVFKEAEADRWAFSQMGKLDETCRTCMAKRSAHCLFGEVTQYKGYLQCK